jgi:hypothetical protein
LCASSKIDNEAVEALVRKQQKLHLNLGVQDVYKLLFQGVMGVAHILEDKEQAKRYLENEFAGVNVSKFLDEPLVEDVSVSGEVVRVNLRPFKRLGPSLNRLFEAMVVSAERMKEDKETFMTLWNRFIGLVKAGRLDFDHEALVEFDKVTKDKGYPPIHHSKEYVRANKPTYRVVDKKVYQKMFK